MKHPDDDKTIDMMENTFQSIQKGIDGMQAENKRGRKQMPAAERITDVVPANVVQQASAAATELTLIQSVIAAEQIKFSQRIGERIGRRRTAAFLQKVVTVADLIELQEIKHSKAYRGMSLPDPSGKVVTVTTWAEFCMAAEGRSVESVDRDLLNLRQLGSDLFESMQRIGLGPAKMRELRKIPEAERAELLQGNGDKELTEEVVQDLLEKHKKQIAKKDDELQAEKKKRVDAEQSAEAARRVAADKNAVIDHLKEKLARPYTPPPGSVAQTAEEESTLSEINDAFQDAHTATLRLATVVDDTLGRLDGTMLASHARTCLDHIVKLLATLAATHDIDVLPTIHEAIEVPAWLASSIGEETIEQVAQFKRGGIKKG